MVHPNVIHRIDNINSSLIPKYYKRCDSSLLLFPDAKSLKKFIIDPVVPNCVGSGLRVDVVRIGCKPL